MTKTEKMTNKKAISYVLENVTDLPADVREKLEAILTSFEKKSSTGKLTKTQQENLALRHLILDFMRDDPNRLMTCTEIGKAIPKLDGASNQKISHLMRGLVDTKEVEKLVEKGKSYFRLAPTEEVEGE